MLYYLCMQIIPKLIPIMDDEELTSYLCRLSEANYPFYRTNGHDAFSAGITFIPKSYAGIMPYLENIADQLDIDFLSLLYNHTMFLPNQIYKTRLELKKTVRSKKLNPWPVQPTDKLLTAHCSKNPPYLWHAHTGPSEGFTPRRVILPFHAYKGLCGLPAALLGHSCVTPQLWSGILPKTELTDAHSSSSSETGSSASGPAKQLNVG